MDAPGEAIRTGRDVIVTRFEDLLRNRPKTVRNHGMVSVNIQLLSFDPRTLIVLTALRMFVSRYKLRVRMAVFTVTHEYLMRHCIRG